MAGCGVGPGEKIVDTGLWVAVDDPGKDVGEVSLGIDSVELGGFDQRGDDGPVFAAAIGTGEERVLAIEGNGADRTFDNVGVDLDAAIVDESGQPLPAGEGIADRFGKLCFLADERELVREPGLELVCDGAALILADGTAFIGGQAADVRLDPVECCDALEGFAGDGRWTCGGQLVEAAADMAPAEGELHRIALGQGTVSGIAVHLQDAGEAIEMGEWPLGLAVWRIDIGHTGRVAATPRPVIARIGPKLTSLGASSSGIEDWCCRHKRGRFSPRRLCPIPRLPQPGEQLLRCQTILPRHRRDHRARHQRLINDPRLLVVRQPATSARPGDRLHPPHRLRLKFMVKHRHKSISHRDQHNRLFHCQSEGGGETALTSKLRLSWSWAARRSGSAVTRSAVCTLSSAIHS